jgi:hypothetical protein
MGRLVSGRTRLTFAAAGTILLLSILQPAPEAQVRTPAAGATEAHAQVEFQTARDCLACHNGLTAPTGEDVSIGVSWQASMMANSARDPYWQAAVRRETIDHPTRAGFIEDECAICHMPMARTLAHQGGRDGEVFALLPGRRGDSHEEQLAADGVSCTLCHQIGTDRLGTRESFVGGFVIAPPGPDGSRMFGPFEVDGGRTALMRSATGVQPTQGTHIESSEVCATCHTLITEALGPNGEVIGTLPEQVPYQEWQHSEFAKTRSCQSCHMPRVADTKIASVVGETREHLGRHTFLGGNFFMLRMLNRYRDELAVTAPAAQLEAAAAATVQQLQSDTARVRHEEAGVENGVLRARVAVRNVTGHKLPTAYPSRRAWLHLTVRSADGKTLFESGAIDPRGAIRGNDNDEDAARFEPHHTVIRRDSDVQIYETIMGRPDGGVTTGLLQATRYLKDNRLLPRGFDKTTAGADIAVLGDAMKDADFTAAGDDVLYEVPVGSAARPLSIEVELRYQPIGFRWAENLRPYDAPEPRRFVGYYESMAAGSSAMLARDAREIR